MYKEDIGRVFIRCRPLINREINLGQVSCVNVNIKEGSIQIENGSKEEKTTFIFNTVFNECDSQRSFYQETTMELVENLFFGLSATVITYGQTGSGKSYCMIGSSDQANKGIIPRSLVELYELLQYPENKSFKVFCSFMNLRDENLTDLLTGNSRKIYISDRITKDKRLLFDDLILEECQTLEQASEVLNKGKLRLGTSSTNEIKKDFDIFTLYILESDECKTTLDIQENAAQLQFIDFAASETVKEGGATYIKTDLDKSPIGYFNQIVSDLSQDTRSVIPYKSCKLTLILQNPLEGHSRMVMIATIAPQKQFIDETIRTLEFAQKMNKLVQTQKQYLINSNENFTKDLQKESIEGQKSKSKFGFTTAWEMAKRTGLFSNCKRTQFFKNKELKSESKNLLESGNQSIGKDSLCNEKPVERCIENSTKNDTSQDQIPTNNLCSEKPSDILFFKALCECFLTSKEINSIRRESIWIEDEHIFQIPEQFPFHSSLTEEQRAKIQSAFDQVATNYQSKKKDQPIQ